MAFYKVPTFMTNFMYKTVYFHNKYWQKYDSFMLLETYILNTSVTTYKK